MCMSLPSSCPHLPSHPSRYHGAPGWAPCVTRQIPASVSHVGVDICQCYSNSSHSLLSHCVHKSALYICFSIPSSQIGSSVVVVQLLSRVQLFSTSWTVAHQAPLSTEFPRQKHWSGLPFPSPGDRPDPGIKPTSPASSGGFFTSKPLRKPQVHQYHFSRFHMYA